MQLRPLSLALITSFASQPVQASSNELDPIIVSANQQAQPLSQVTADTYIIDSETLKAKHYSTLIDALREVPGISFTRNGPLGSTTSLYMRGSNNSRTLILLDGVRLNDPSNTDGANLASISLANIERIEIIKGAQSGVWGADAAAGVINLISKQSSGHEINLETGSYNTQKAAFNSQFLIGESQKHKLNIGGERLLSDGFTAQAPADEDIDQYEEDGIAQTNLNAKLDFDLGNQQHLILSHNHTDTYGEYDGYMAPDSQQRYENTTALSSLIWRNPETEIRLEQSDFSSEQLDGFGKDKVDGLVQAAHIKHQIKQLVLGADYSFNQTDTDKYGTQKRDRTTSKSVFATYALSLENWQFNQAIRWDNYSNFDSEITGKIGAKYTFAPQHSLSANFGTAYNAPSQTQILNPWGTANPDLTPEKSQEASITYLWHGLSASYFDKKVEDLISWSGGQFQNLEGESKIRGYEIGYQHDFASADLNIDYTHLDTEDANGDELPRRPHDQIGVDLTWYANSVWDLNLNGQYIGERSEGNKTNFYTVINAVINYQANRQTRIYLKLDNLFDRYYQVVNGYATAERSAYLGLNYQF